MDTAPLPSLRLIDSESVQAVSHNDLLSSLSLMIASGLAQTKAALGRATGLPRSSVSGYTDELLRRGVIRESGVIASDRGRPAERLLLSPALGLILIADVGAAHVTLAIADLNMTLLIHESHRRDVRQYSPLSYLKWLTQQLQRLADVAAPNRRFGLCVLGLPARIDTHQSMAVRPPNMPEWDAFDASRALSGMLKCPVVIENDVNLRALGEASSLPSEQRPVFAVKIGTGIGSGIVDTHGRVFHGFDGAAGEIGHTPTSQGLRIRCRCGNLGCLEAIAAVPGMIARLHDLTDAADDVLTVEDLMVLVRAQDEAALQVVRESGQAVGEIVAALCNALNPRRVVIGGLITLASDELLAKIRTSVYQLGRPLATRNLIIAHSGLGQLAGVAGAMVLGAQSALSPQYLFAKRQATSHNS